MLLVEILDVALVARLCHAAHFVALGLCAFDFPLALGGVRRDDEHAGAVGIGEEHEIAAVFVEQPRQRIEVRDLGDAEAVRRDRRGELEPLEQVRAGAREYGQSVGRRVYAVEIGRDPLGVALQAAALGRVGVRIHARAELFADEGPEGVATSTVWLQVQIKADHRVRARFKGRQAIELRREFVEEWHDWRCRKPRTAACHSRPVQLQYLPVPELIQSRMTRPIEVLVPLLVAAAAAVLYARQLDVSPPVLHPDEIAVVRQANAITLTGHDLEGRRLPLFFRVHDNLWTAPLPVYFTALLSWLGMLPA